MTGQELVNWIAAAGALNADIAFDLAQHPPIRGEAPQRLWLTTQGEVQQPFDAGKRPTFVVTLVRAPR